MKTLKAICPTLVLVLVLGVPAYAGDIQTPGSPAPTPTPMPQSASAECSTTGDIGTDFAEILWALASIF